MAHGLRFTVNGLLLAIHNCIGFAQKRRQVFGLRSTQADRYLETFIGTP